MKNILGLILLLIITFTSCNRPKSKKQALFESVKAFKKNTVLKIYEPEHFFERKVDTLLSNGFRVNIKIYLDKNRTVIFNTVKNSINQQIHYRNYKFDILIEKNGKKIYTNTFNKEQLNTKLGYGPNLNTNAPLYNFDTLAILKHIAVNEAVSTNNYIFIDLAYAIPNKSGIAWHTLKIDPKGNANFI